jgi:hypothetical protein
LSTSSDWFISVPELLVDTDPAESGQCSWGELQSNELFVVSFRFTVHQSERSEIRCFPGPMNVSSLVSVDRQLDRDWHSPIFYNERKSGIRAQMGPSGPKWDG